MAACAASSAEVGNFLPDIGEALGLATDDESAGLLLLVFSGGTGGRPGDCCGLALALGVLDPALGNAGTAGNFVVAERSSSFVPDVLDLLSPDVCVPQPRR